MRRVAGLLTLALLTPLPAQADTAVARRLAALRVLATPAVFSEPGPRTGHSPNLCSAGAWWQQSDYARRERTQRAIRDASLRFGVDARLLRAVIREESAGNAQAVSHKGAMGLMQLMPGTAAELGVVCAFDPRQNVTGGARYLRHLRDRLGSWPRALAGYHAGPGAVAAERIPGETRAYVARVMRRWEAAR